MSLVTFVAVPEIIFGGCSGLEAMRNSFRACVHNLGAMVVFYLLMLVSLFAITFTVQLLAMMVQLVAGPGAAIWVIVAYSLINFVVQSIIQPRFTGDAVGLNATVTFLSLVFWAWVLGPLGALLAVPLTLFVKAVFIDRDPRGRWLNAFVSDTGS